jgi:hypothetical protein
VATAVTSYGQRGPDPPPQKFSDYSVYKRKCFDEFNIFLKFLKIGLKID